MKLALVIPWFGRELKGGAEQQAWQVATRLSARGHAIEVLTTCCRSHQEDWATNHLKEGEFQEPEGFLVHRFRVDPRDRNAFDQVCARLLQTPPCELRPGVSPVTSDEAAIFVDELIRSEALLDFLRQNRRRYDWFIFLPYLYGPIIRCIGIVKERAILQPCLHNESYAYLPQVAEAFYQSARLLFNSEGEKELAIHLFGPGLLSKSCVVGEGVEVLPPNNGQADCAPLSHQAVTNKIGRYILYLGRKDAGKNVPLLVESFRRFRAVRPNSDLQLVLAGHGTIELERSSHTIDLGLVSEAEKSELLEGCVALAQPSTNESFSRVIMEAWLHGKPVIAQRSCLATALPIEQAGGGWLAESEDEWAEVFTYLDRTPANELSQIGQGGKQYAAEIADWDKVIDRYEAALALPRRKKGGVCQRRRIHQVLPNLAFGDAISNLAILHRNHLRQEGFESEILVRHIDPRVAQDGRVFDPGLLQPTDAIIYHHSIGTDLTPHVVAHPGPKLLIYHNITPAEFFEPFAPEFAEILRNGRRDLEELAQFFPHSAGDSSYNAEELHAAGFRDPKILPITVDPEKWNLDPEPEVMDKMQDGRTNILFVGRVAPNKKQEELVEAFSYYLSLDPAARLVLLGPVEAGDSYVAHLHATIRRLGLESCVCVTGSVTEAQLSAYYRTAHLYWSMSEHEGFGVPMVEAMWFDVPVFAKNASAVSETLGDAALMFSGDMTPVDAAACAHLLVKDTELRRHIIRAQRKQRELFTKRAVTPVFEKAISSLV